MSWILAVCGWFASNWESIAAIFGLAVAICTTIVSITPASWTKTIKTLNFVIKVLNMISVLNPNGKKVVDASTSDASTSDASTSGVATSGVATSGSVKKD